LIIILVSGLLFIGPPCIIKEKLLLPHEVETMRSFFWHLLAHRVFAYSVCTKRSVLLFLLLCFYSGL